MKIKKAIKGKIEKTELGNQLLNDRRYRAVSFAVLGLILNLLYAFYNGALGILNHSVWFTASCIYYLLMSTMRFTAILCGQKNSVKKEYALMGLTGILFGVLGFVLIIIIYLSLAQNVASKYDEITMITIATYTFAKISMAITGAVKHRKEALPLMTVIQNIRYMEVAVSVVTMQRSMLVTFGDMNRSDAEMMNMLTGAGACLFAVVLGIIMIKNSRKGKMI